MYSIYIQERERERERNFKKGKKTTNIDLTFFLGLKYATNKNILS